MSPALLLGGALSAALWLHGLGEVRMQVLFSAGFVVAAAVTAAVRIARGCRGSGGGRDRLWLLPLAGLMALVACQAVNPSHYFLPDSRALAPVAHVPFLPSSVDRVTTSHALLLLVGYASAFWLARVFLVDFRSRAAFVSMQVACGVGMALLVILQREVPPDGALYPVTGAFVSPNHFAAYTNLLLPVALLWGLELHRQARVRGGWVHGGYLLLGAAAVLLISVFQNNSRMGMAVSVVLVAAVVAWEAWAVIVPRLRRGWGAAVFALLTAAGGLLALSSASAVTEPWCWTERVSGDVVSRFPVWRAALAMWADRWVAGTGAGTFELAFPYYQPHSVPGFYRHAHNEYLQILAEVGVVGVVLLGCMLHGMLAGETSGRLAGYLRSLICLPATLCRRRLNSGPGHARWPGAQERRIGQPTCAQALTARERRGIILALTGLAMHAMVDFPLRLPALVLLASAWVGMSEGQLWRRESWKVTSDQ